MNLTDKGKILPILLAVCCIALAVILAAGAIVLYVDGAARRAENPLESIYTAEKAGQVMKAALPLFLVFLCALVISIALGVKPKTGKASKNAVRMKPQAEPKHVNTIRTVVIIAAVILIIAGILNGGALDVLVKAINICTECVGLG
ncbi:MAG: hypothetical protein IJK71_08270 [Clostridia bacterium]|nr:hypothetical protein [Clostridia bacterium]